MNRLLNYGQSSYLCIYMYIRTNLPFHVFDLLFSLLIMGVCKIKKAVIIGATSGIGRAVAQLLWQKGVDIAIAGRREKFACRFCFVERRTGDICAARRNGRRCRRAFGRFGGTAWRSGFDIAMFGHWHSESAIGCRKGVANDGNECGRIHAND